MGQQPDQEPVVAESFLVVVCREEIGAATLERLAVGGEGTRKRVTLSGLAHLHRYGGKDR